MVGESSVSLASGEFATCPVLHFSAYCMDVGPSYNSNACLQRILVQYSWSIELPASIDPFVQNQRILEFPVPWVPQQKVYTFARGAVILWRT